MVFTNNNCSPIIVGFHPLKIGEIVKIGNFY